MRTPIFKRKDVSVAELKAYVERNLSHFFSDYVSDVTDRSIYSNTSDEILFLSRTNQLNLVKVCEQSDAILDQFVDDYVSVSEKWAQIREGSQYTTQQFDEAISVTLIMQEFDAKWLRRLKLLALPSLVCLQIKVLVNEFGALSYYVEQMQPNENQSQKKIQVEKTASVKYQASRSSENVMEKEAPVSLKIPVEVEAESNFFDRAQLSEDEHRSFSMLNEKMKEQFQKSTTK